jgi:hypothetical protein
MAKDAIVSQDLADKFKTEKDSPYLRFVREEGLDIISAQYVPNLRTVELKPWARKSGKGVFINHEASRTSNDCYVCEIAPGKKLEPQHRVEQCRRSRHLRVEGRRDLRHPAQLLVPAFQRFGSGGGALRRGDQRAVGDQSL